MLAAMPSKLSFMPFEVMIKQTMRTLTRSMVVGWQFLAQHNSTAKTRCTGILKLQRQMTWCNNIYSTQAQWRNGGFKLNINVYMIKKNWIKWRDGKITWSRMIVEVCHYMTLKDSRSMSLQCNKYFTLNQDLCFLALLIWGWKLSSQFCCLCLRASEYNNNRATVRPPVTLSE